MMKQNYSPLSAMVAELRRCSGQLLTGMLSFVCENNRSGRISLDSGQVVAAQYQGKNGPEALKLISQIEGLRFRFQEGPIPPARVAMPTFEGVCAQLSGQGDGGPVVVPEPPASSTPNKPGPPKRGGLSPGQKETIQEVLAECIGPMAMLLCEDHLGDATDLESVIQALAEELTPQQAELFRNTLKARLG
jgi:hypothetical protein